MLKKFFGLTFFIFLNSLIPVFAQQKEHQLTVIPPSPTASSLGKYGEIPVGNYTGIPQINIPLYTVKQGSLDCPISLSYHAGGIKVEEMASWVGLGFSLRSGGAITRSFRGLPDESGSFFNPANNLNTLLTAGGTQFNNFLFGLANSTEDGESDMYQFSIGNDNGSFFYDQSGTIHTLPLSRVQIIKTTAGWKVTNTAGVTYFFETPEYTVSEKICDGASSPGPGLFNTSPTAWYISRIISADLADTIKFEYDQFISNYEMTPVETRYQLYATNIMSGACNMTNVTCKAFNKIYGQRLKKIIFKTGYVNFSAATDREDLSGDKSLDYVEIFRKDGTLYKRFHFYYSYFDSYIDNAGCQGMTYNVTKRLKLDSLSEETLYGRTPPHAFSYNTTYPLPCRTSYARDHWGYYNGKTANNTLVPPFPYVTPSGNYLEYAGADRSVSAIHAQANTLNKIVYPTGGTTLFEYESNTLWNANNVLDPVLNGVSVAVGEDAPQAVYTKDFTINFSPNNINAYLGGVLATVTASKIWLNGTPVNAFLEELDANGNRLSILNFPRDTVLTQYHLHNGIYRLNVQLPLPLSTNDLSVYDGFGIFIMWREPGAPGTGINELVGGLRIKKIYDIGSNNEPVNVRVYDYNFPNNQSSGGAANNINYTHQFSRIVHTGDENYNMYHYCNYTVRQAYTNLPLTQTAGSHVGYQYVKVSTTGNGYSTYQYTTPLTDPDEVYPVFPYAPPTSYEWKRGLLIRQEDYVEGTTIPIRVKQNIYRSDLVSPQSYSAITAAYSSQTNFQTNYPPDYTVYPVATEFLYLETTYDTLFDKNNHSLFLATKNAYEYGPNTFQIARVTQTNSKGLSIVNGYKYPEDYSNSAMQSVIGTLKQKNILTPIIQSTTLTNGNLTAGEITSFTGYGQPVEKHVLQVATPVADIAFDATNFNPRPDLFQLKQTIAYDPVTQRPVTNTATGNFTVSYIWDYNQTLPIASVINAAVSDIAYTSFESDGKGNWNNYTGSIIAPAEAPPTGKKYYNLTASSPLIKSVLSGSVYIISYWSNAVSPFTINGGSSETKTGRTIGGWTYHEHKVTTISTTLTIAGFGAIDEVRCYPQGAQMTTYTYDPLIGMTSQVDPNNRIVYYEYDFNGRLSIVRDDDKNILKWICYNYYGQPEDCYPVASRWESTGNTRCKPCPYNSNYISNIIQREERDINSQSPTYNQVRWTDSTTSNTCIVNADWQNTATSVRCKTDANNQNTGQQEQEQRDMNPCSGTYGELRWVVVGTNTTTCPVTTTIYARMELTNYNAGTINTTATLRIAFYSDMACTNSVSVSNLTVNYRSKKIMCVGGTVSNNDFTVTCNGTGHLVGTVITSGNEETETGCFAIEYFTTTGAGYTHLPSY